MKLLTTSIAYGSAQEESQNVEKTKEWVSWEKKENGDNGKFI
jgi:hypothetical protein